MNLVNLNGTPALLGKVPVVACKLVADPFGYPGRSVERYGAWCDMYVSHKVVEAHQVVHVGVTDENGIHRTQDPFCQVVELPAIDKYAAAGWPDINVQDRVIKQSGEKTRLQIAVPAKILHGGSVHFSQVKYNWNCGKGTQRGYLPGLCIFSGMCRPDALCLLSRPIDIFGRCSNVSRTNQEYWL